MRVSFTIDDEVIDQLDAVAKELGRNRSNLIQRVINEYLMKYHHIKGVKEESK